MVKRKNEGKPVHALIKVMRGTYRRDRDEGKLILPDQLKEIPTPPVNYSDQTKDMWYKICTTLMAVGLLQNIGINQIEIYCDQYQIYKDALKMVNDKGSVIKVTSKNGNSVIKRNPYMDVMGTAFVIMNQISDRFGFSPLAQARIKTAAAKPIDDNPEEQKKKKYNL